MEELRKVIAELKVPKNQLNKFGGFKYRSCEDILEAVKPLLFKHKLDMDITDDVVSIGQGLFVRSTVTVRAGDKERSTSAFAEIATEKKGMDKAQITGSTSSYARKYALNGMFLIDDSKDSDYHPEKETEQTDDIEQIKAKAVEILISLNLPKEDAKRKEMAVKLNNVKTKAQAEQFLKDAEKLAGTAELVKLKFAKEEKVEDEMLDEFDDDEVPATKETIGQEKPLDLF